MHTFGGLTKIIESRMRDSPIVMEDFDDHTVFVCGKPVIDPSTQRLVVVLSTENLLLNSYRATVYGMPLQIQIDTTYRLVVEGHGTILIGHTSLDQVFHAVGYAVVSREDTIGHEESLRALKETAESLVAERRRTGRPI